MSEKRSKYDTDPLDPDFARRTEEMSGGATGLMEDAPTEHLGGATRPMQPADQARLNPEGEAPTRLIDEKLAQPYQSVFVPPAYQPPRQSTFGQQQPPPNFAPQGYAPPPAHPPSVYAPPATKERNVAGLGIPEKFACALPYAPFKIGLIVAIIELLITPRAEGRTRFHAAQGLALQLGILVVQIALSVFSNIAGGNFGGFLFAAASLFFLIYSLVRVWRGDDYRIAPLEDAVRWLNTKIDPKK
ncbi:MAG TPA: hypothetical protein VM864_11055 [Pyrinomonadaceae bacterium]|jgi:uncharacterized membrane protein|nr:hypothetical protein [Pyrinomonadaceae bacterium]